jgi:hypothetical protein
MGLSLGWLASTKINAREESREKLGVASVSRNCCLLLILEMRLALMKAPRALYMDKHLKQFDCLMLIL